MCVYSLRSPFVSVDFLFVASHRRQNAQVLLYVHVWTKCCCVYKSYIITIIIKLFSVGFLTNTLKDKIFKKRRRRRKHTINILFTPQKILIVLLSVSRILRLSASLKYYEGLSVSCGCTSKNNVLLLFANYKKGTSLSLFCRGHMVTIFSLKNPFKDKKHDTIFCPWW